jgi:integrase/recombinase XerD
MTMPGIQYPQAEVLPLDGARLDQVQLLVVGYLARYKGTTRRTYAGVINRWITWCHRYGVDPLDVQRAHIELWARQLEEIDMLRDSTIGNYLNAICGLYRFAHLDGYLATNPSAYVRRPKLERVSRSQYLTRTELLTVIDLAEPTAPTRSPCAAARPQRPARLGGVRDPDRRHRRERGYHTVFVHRKGGKTQTLPLAPRTSWAVDQAIAGRTHGHLLHAPTGNPMAAGSATRSPRGSLCSPWRSSSPSSSATGCNARCTSPSTTSTSPATPRLVPEPRQHRVTTADEGEQFDGSARYECRSARGRSTGALSTPRRMQPLSPGPTFRPICSARAIGVGGVSH